MWQGLSSSYKRCEYHPSAYLKKSLGAFQEEEICEIVVKSEMF